MLLFIIMFLGLGFPGGLKSLWKQADRAFRQKQYEEAARLYEEAHRQEPKQWPLAFNMAVAQAAAQKYDAATTGFEKIAQSGPESLRQMAEYNAGNCYFAQQKWQQAIEHYKRALYLNPQDFNAKWNLELAKRMQKQQQRNNEQQRKPQQKSRSLQQKPSPPQPPRGQPQKQDEAAPRPQKMDAQQARRLLQSLSQAERDLHQKMAKQRQQPFAETRPAKDW